MPSTQGIGDVHRQCGFADSAFHIYETDDVHAIAPPRLKTGIAFFYSMQLKESIRSPFPHPPISSKPLTGQSSPVRQEFAPWADPLATPCIRYDDMTKQFADQLALVDLSPPIHQCAFSCLRAPPFILSDGHAADAAYISHVWARNQASSRSNVKVPASRLSLMKAKAVSASAVMRRPLIARNV